MAGAQAFREAFLSASSDALTNNADLFSTYEARQLRYSLNWAFYENNAYRSIHSWATKFKSDLGLYEFVRGIYNPAYRIGDFWQSHLWGGALDPNAGDGAMEPNALPIAIPDVNGQTDALRLALATLWRDSNWQTNKDLTTLFGTILGDVALRVTDDPERGKVYLGIVHPASIVDVTLDPFGNVKGYWLEEQRDDPLFERKTPTDVIPQVTYREICSRDGDHVVFQTFLDGNPYGWQNDAAGMPIDTWSEPYGFVPMVFIKHIDIGKPWGVSELHSQIGKIAEADDLASKFHDQIRKVVDAPMLLAGVDDPKKKVAVRGSTGTPNTSQTKRQETPVLYAPTGANAIPLIGTMDIAGALATVKELLVELERDHPELRDDIWNAGGDVSGRALRIARQRIETVGQKRRPNYDNALVRAQQMAVAIGGWRGYVGYAGFNLDSYGAGTLAHAIGKRPMFTPDPMDDLEQKKLFWEVVSTTVAGSGGEISAEMVLRDLGWDDAQIEASGMLQRTTQDVIPTVAQ